MIVNKVVFQPNEDGALVEGYDPVTERGGWWLVIGGGEAEGVVTYAVKPVEFRVAAPQTDD